MLRILLLLCVALIPLFPFAQEQGSGDMLQEDSSNTLSDLNAIPLNNSKIQVSWRLNSEPPSFFAIERSDNGKAYETVGILNNIQKAGAFQWTDDAPRKGRNFYRIRFSFGEGAGVHTAPVSAAVAGYSDFKFYPNPVDQLLIIRSDAPLDVQISDANGRLRISESRVKGIHTINVSALEKGIYVIRFTNKLTNVISQDKLVKN